MKKIYKVYRIDKVGYDEYGGFIVRASNPKEAKSLIPGWGDADKPKIRVREVKLTGRSEIILEDFNAA